MESITEKIIRELNLTCISLDHGYDTPLTLSHELQYIDYCLENSDKVLNVVTMPRQEKKTTYIMIHALREALVFGKRCVIICNKKESAIEIYRRIFDIKSLKEFIDIKYSRPGWIQFTIGCNLRIMHCSPGACRGAGFDRLYLDEFDFHGYSTFNEFWKATYPVISSCKNGKIYGFSTPLDAKNTVFKNIFWPIINEGHAMHIAFNRELEGDILTQSLSCKNMKRSDLTRQKELVDIVGDQKRWDCEFGAQYKKPRKKKKEDV